MNITRQLQNKRIQIIVPYSTALSKNRMYVRAASGQVRSSTDTIAERDGIAFRLRGERRGDKWDEIKTHVHYHVHRPNMKGDPVNFQDVILDGVKEGIGVDDRWFTCSCTWELTEEIPVITITVTQ